MDFALREYPFNMGNTYYGMTSEEKKQYFVVVSPSPLKEKCFDVLLNRLGEMGFWKIGTVPSKDNKTLIDAVESYNKKHNLDELVFD